MWLNVCVQACARVCVIEFARFENHPWRLSASVDLVFGTAILHAGAEAIRRLRSFSGAKNGPFPWTAAGKCHAKAGGMRWLCAKWDAVDVVATGTVEMKGRRSGRDEVAVCKMGCCRCGSHGDWTGAGTVEMK